MCLYTLCVEEEIGDVLRGLGEDRGWTSKPDRVFLLYNADIFLDFVKELTSANDGNVAEDLMQNHDVFLSTLRSHLTKLQVVRHFWERNNIKGAIDATRKLADHSVGTSRPDQYSHGENGDSHLRLISAEKLPTNGSEGLFHDFNNIFSLVGVGIVDGEEMSALACCVVDATATAPPPNVAAWDSSLLAPEPFSLT
ncbi:hypothetical protein HYC85_017794 [Camellia sinensis]|uniref:Katanin p80 subunit C-terminal domain-containing protein n=1 Tax=Camellia sinensis TaxID=4442 RepID=A0A7J7GTD6_CAMSI|nr:hypothetical protein HYC85_017794 [Camellia sinensis]